MNVMNFLDCFIEPIKIIDVTEKGINYTSIISILFGSISTGYFVWEKVIKTKVYGKVISKTYSQNGKYTFTNFSKESKEITGQQYILKFSLTCLRKNLYYKDVKVNLTYKGEIISGFIYYTNYNTNTNMDGSVSKIKTPADQFITFNTVLEKDKVNFYYIKFIVENKKGPIMYDELELEFVRPNNKTIKVKIDEIDNDQFFYDETLVEKIT